MHGLDMAWRSHRPVLTLPRWDYIVIVLEKMSVTDAAVATDYPVFDVVVEDESIA